MPATNRLAPKSSKTRRRAAGGLPQFGRGSGIPHPVDVHVGTRVRASRQLRGMTQQTLARDLGLTFQQVQKYESGTNRISASKLALIAKIVQLPVSFFFADYAAARPAAAREDYERLYREETIDLIRFYYQMPDSRVREAFLAMMRAVAAAKPAL